MKKGLIFALGFVAAILLGTLFFYLSKNVPSPTETTQPTPTAEPTKSPEAIDETEIDTAFNWKTYTNSQFGFKISYPPAYEALDDNTNLYGWPNGIVLLYKGGQSYDLAIEQWNSVSEYEAKYPNQSNLAVKKVGNKYITLLNTNFESEVDEIIQTFKVVE